MINIRTITSIAMLALCLSLAVACNSKAPVDSATQTAPAAPSGLADEEKEALAADLALEAEETIDENNAESALSELKAEIEADN